ncbi:MAG: PBECR4 domain-containing protein [Streptococcus sp.]|nr:PBECR4 domain-containing protein [Streptococcus sp.]
MEEAHTQQPTPRGKSRRERVEHARSRDILDVANELNIELVQSGRDYRWKEHDSMVVSPKKNMWNWFSRHQGGDVIALVQTMKEVDFNQAIDFLNDGTFKEFTKVEHVRDPFSYYLAPYEQPFEAARSYLKDQRGLSDETIDFFFEKGVLAQANAKVNGSIKPVVVFKSLDFSGEIVGATLQGIEENWEKWPERGYAKNIVRNSDGIIGMHVDIGQPNRLVFAESAIDLMSYYELHRDGLQDVRLISMDGLKEAVVGRHVAQLQSEVSGRPLTWSHDQLAEGLQTAIDNGFFADGKHADWITLAVDNDEGGWNFIDSLREKGATVTEDLPILKEGEVKTDWNDALKQPLIDNSRLGQARRKLDRLNQEFSDATDAVYSHSAMANGQPMNDKRGGTAFFKRKDQLENKVFNKLDEIKKQEERVERLEQQQRFKEEGLNRKGNGLDMSVQNIHRIREELEKAERGESHYTRETIKRYQEELKRLEGISEQMSSVTIQPGTQSLIDDGSVNQWAKQPNLYFVKGLRRVAVELTEEGTFVPSTKYRPRTDEEKAVLDNLLDRQNDVTPTSDHATEPELQVVFDFSENPKLSKQYSSGEVIPYSDFIAKLYKENDWQLIIPESGYDKTYFALQDELGNSLISNMRYDIGSEREALSEQLSQALPAPYLEMAQEADQDYRSQVSYDTLKSNQKTEKPLEVSQEATESEQQKNERTSQYKGSLQPEAEGSTAPVSETDTFDRSVTSRPTRSSHYLEFTINGEFKSRKTRLDTSVDKEQLAKINRFADTIQAAARFYQEELANSKINYFTSSGDVVQVNFLEKNFVHLTGLKFIGNNQTPEKTLRDLAAGGTHSFDDIRISNTESAFSKVKVLPELKAALQTDSFYFDNLQNISRYTDKFHSLIKSSDQDLMLLFRDTEESGTVPISVFKSRSILEKELLDATKNEILGIYRDRDGVIEQIDVNEKYISDGGQEMLSILENKQYEEALESTQENVQNEAVSAELFTQVLDSAYNVGNPRKLGLQVSEESKGAWERYYELSDSHEGNFSAVVDAADRLGLVDKTSNFYQEWHQDQVYQNNYHVRLQWSETWPEGPQIPFKEAELVDYQTFAETLYKENKAFYERHHGSVTEVTSTGNQEAYIPYTKVKFDVYAPGGTLIKSDVRYDVGDEIEPISRLLGLGYRRLEGQSELAAIDEMVLSQLENQEVNQEIAAEANEQSLKVQEVLPDEASRSRGSFHSPNQELKTGLAQRVEEILAEDATNILLSSVSQIQENLSVEGNLVGTPQIDGQMLYTNREDFGQDYQLELAVHSPMMIDNLSDTQAPWTLAVIKEEHKLGYLAYGSDWGNDFQIEEELEKLSEQIGSERAPEGLYKQEEVDAFLADSQINKDLQGDLKSVATDEPFDYSSASAYEISEHAFQKIREYTQSPKDLLEYMDFMSKFPQLSPRNVALIHEQWRGANAVATYDQWQAMGDVLGIKPEDVIQTKAVYTNKRTGETKEVLHQSLSVKTGEKSKITLFRPLMVRMIPVVDEYGNHVKNDKGNPKYKKFSDATPQEKALVKEGKLPVRQFQERDSKTGQPRFTTYKVFELSQTTLKPESYPKAMPNRHYNFNLDKVKTKEVLDGLCDYAESISVKMMKDEARVLGNAKGAFYPEEQLILINPDNTPGEKIATTVHELAHATLHNPKLAEQYKELPKGQKELEAEMTSHLLSKHFGLDTSEKAIDYMASWTDNLKALDDKQLADSLKRVHQTVSKMLKQVENHTKPYQLGKKRGQSPNFPKAPTKGPSR